MLPVIHSEIQYKQPIFYDERMDIRVLLFDTPSVRLNTYYEIRHGGGGKSCNYTGSGYAGFLRVQRRADRFVRLNPSSPVILRLT